MKVQTAIRSQMSIEFLVYTGITAASLVVMLAVYIKAGAAISAMDANSGLENFAGTINMNMEYQRSTFIAYVPPQICGASVVNGSIIYSGSLFELAGPLSLDNALLCGYAGRFARLSLVQEPNGTFALR
jgi:hypothetical protein